MRTLPKHLRPRWRYLGVEIETWPGARLDRRSLQGALWDAARGLLGDPGSADCDLTVTRFAFDSESGTGEAIVRVRRDERERGRAALACVAEVEGYPTGLVVRGTSGTIRACAQRYLRGRTESSTGTEATVPFRVDDRTAVRKRGGRLDVHMNEGFVGATELDVEAETDSDSDIDAGSRTDPDTETRAETETPEGGE